MGEYKWPTKFNEPTVTHKWDTFICDIREIVHSPKKFTIIKTFPRIGCDVRLLSATLDLRGERGSGKEWAWRVLCGGGGSGSTRKWKRTHNNHIFHCWHMNIYDIRAKIFNFNFMSWIKNSFSLCDTTSIHSSVHSKHLVYTCFATIKCFASPKTLRPREYMNVRSGREGSWQ